MAKFRVGDVCIGQNFECDTRYNGRECEVLCVCPEGETGCYSFSARCRFEIPPVAYQVEWEEGRRTFVHESNLRKRPPEQGWKSFEKATKIKTRNKVSA